ncbi:MAG: hypothetical protein LBT67_00980, partial [Holosporaceae bacterium]|nr:hypothetical protein [Holosporaceae bacterium]
MRHFFLKIASLKKKLKSSNSGYVLILTTIFLPILFFGIKYAVDNSKVRSFSMERQKKDEQRTVLCGKEAALAAAKLWNPGATLTNQKAHVVKAADDIYNRFAAMDSVIAGAIPGMDSKKFNSSETSNLLMKYIAILYNAISRASDAKTIKYADQTDNLYKTTVTVPSSLNVHAILYYFTEALAKQNYLSPLEENDVLSDISVFGGNKFSFICSEKYSNLIASTLSSLTASLQSSISSSSTKKDSSYSYPVRENESTDKINLYLSAGNITVKSDGSNEGKAIPATCNVDIILALPVNGVACSASSGDYTTSPIGSPYTTGSDSSTSSTVSAPICEISRCYRKFLKNNFFHTRGTNVGIIPYSSKISLSEVPSRADWTRAVAAFSTSNDDKYIYGKNLYGTSGVKDAALVQASYSWGADGVYSIMHRYTGYTNTPPSSLLSTTTPSGNNSFVKMNLNPCYMGYANTLGMKCEKDCTKFQPNPYPIVELTADVKAAYEILGCYFPFYDAKNASNFIFLAMEWANNLLSGNWNQDPIASGDSNTVQRESKTTGSRKKAVIIVVNKPDWFEPGELTYLGFDNDAAALPIYESDKINFAIDYSSTSKNFLDGTSYNGTIAGPKKILTFESSGLKREGNYYETNGKDTKTGVLYFPEKRTVTLKVARATGSPSGWQKIDHNLNTWGHDNYSGLAHGNGYYVSIGVGGDVARSSNMT